MILQNEIWLITLLGLAAVTLGFIFVIAQAGKPTDSNRVQNTANAIRRWWFLALVVFGIGVTWATLKPFPIPDQHTPLKAAQVVNVVAHQWAWQLSRNQLEAGVPVEFRVTSADVNHGFAIYAPDERIVIQTQAMPGFTNKLLYTFRQPGTYRIRCLEYCGLEHHAMMAELEVVAAARGDQS
ncbi:cupredoxin domain-containing protein [Nitrococcus mobilis]|uniref:Possible cytochrome-c oxidase chain II n=1 Tax=Nitrococcus mobilis Nb-231 TaxID=314278 RepID=A4BSP8_9GAMM|nr:cytochrome oxidase [Nitrococcus mobilis]EAR21318.1 possible cytochrome-c oxidase chain II [Nitrococcus mobilis Nb-231]